MRQRGASIKALRAALGMDKCFAHVATKGPTEEFGGVALSSNMTQNTTVLADLPTLLLRVDPNLYRDTIGWFARSLLERKAALLQYIPELRQIRASPKLLFHIADNMDQIKIPVGTTIDAD
jgi:hypothetical protein